VRKEGEDEEEEETGLHGQDKYCRNRGARHSSIIMGSTKAAPTSEPLSSRLVYIPRSFPLLPLAFFLLKAAPSAAAAFPARRARTFPPLPVFMNTARTRRPPDLLGAQEFLCFIATL
jgi:hypothetical protein